MALFSRKNLKGDLILFHTEKYWDEYLSFVCDVNRGKQIFNIKYKVFSKHPKVDSFETSISIGEADAKILLDFIENYDEYDSSIFIGGIEKHTGIEIDLGFKIQIKDDNYSKEIDIDYNLTSTEIDELENYLKANL